MVSEITMLILLRKNLGGPEAMDLGNIGGSWLKSIKAKLW